VVVRVASPLENVAGFRTDQVGSRGFDGWSELAWLVPWTAGHQRVETDGYRRKCSSLITRMRRIHQRPTYPTAAIFLSSVYEIVLEAPSLVLCQPPAAFPSAESRRSSEPVVSTVLVSVQVSA